MIVWLTWCENICGARNGTILFQTDHINHFSDLENVGRAISSHSSSSRKLKFNVGGEVIFLPAPCDLSQEKYNFSSTVESRPIPKSQLSVIISSYEQTIGNFFINFCLQLRSNSILPICVYICLFHCYFPLSDSCNCLKAGFQEYTTFFLLVEEIYISS